MNSDDKKPEEVLGDLEGIRDLLDESEIPTLEQSIPELNERVAVEDNFKVSLDTENSTETVEQQLARTHHEESSAPLELIPELTEKLSIDSESTNYDTDKDTDTDDNDENLDFSFKLIKSTEESEKQFSQIENISQNSVYEIESVDFNIQGVTTDHLQPHQHVIIQNEDIDTLDQQQLDIEQVAEQEFANTQREESFDEVEISDLILNKAWIKVESLLMDNLPPQLSGAFLQLLNSRVEENKLQLFEELSLLDKESINELLDALGIDQGF